MKLIDGLFRQQNLFNELANKIFIIKKKLVGIPPWNLKMMHWMYYHQGIPNPGSQVFFIMHEECAPHYLSGRKVDHPQAICISGFM